MYVLDADGAAGGSDDSLQHVGIRHAGTRPPMPHRLAGTAKRLAEVFGVAFLKGEPMIEGHDPTIKQIVYKLSNTSFVDGSTNLFNFATMSNRIKELRKARGWSQQRLADATSTSNQHIGYLERGERGLTVEWMDRIARAMDISPSELLRESSQVPLVGYVGAGSEAHFYDGADPPEEWVKAPVGGSEATVAVRVRGDSLGTMFNRWLVYYDQVRTPPGTDLLRKLCVVGLSDGRVLVKQLVPGSRPGTYHLLSQTEGIIEDAEVTWAAEVRAMTPH